MHNPCTNHAHGLRHQGRAAMFCAAGLVAAFAAAVHADDAGADATRWIEAARLCLSAVEAQDVTGLRALPEAPHLGMVEGMPQISGALDGLIVTAFADMATHDWFLCTGRDPAGARATAAGGRAKDAALDRSWTEALPTTFADGFADVTILHPTQVGPARVRCREGGLVAVFGFRDEGGFVLGVADRMPPNVASPCGEGVS